MTDRALANTAGEFKSLTAEGADWFIRSGDDVGRHLRGADSPLAGIPDEAVTAFIDSLEFKNGGLAHADYASLVDHISLKNFHALWAAFGISPTLFSDYDNKWCAGTHICDNQAWKVCSSNC